MTAPSAPIPGYASDSRLGQMCQTAIEGRRAARALGEWAARYRLGESELQILWCLGRATGPGVDQTTLAALLAFSPAQVSACVEKLRARGLTSHQDACGDRRRHLWQLSAGGNDLLQKIVQAAGESREAAA